MSALTKILIVLQLVFSLVCAVLLVLMVSKSENYKTEVVGLKSTNVTLAAQATSAIKDATTADARASSIQGQYDTLNNAKIKSDATSASDLSEAKQANLSLQSDLAAAKAQIATLQASNSTAMASIAAKDEELTKLRPQVADLTVKNSESDRALNEANNQLRAAEKSIRSLQELVAKAAGAGAAGAVSTDQVQTISSAAASAKVNGQISDVAQSSGRVLIEMPLGTRDGIQVGTKMYVYRATGYVGDATVQRVTADQAVAVVMSTKPGETVQKGDYISTTGK